jgi:hypothetical protein
VAAEVLGLVARQHVADALRRIAAVAYAHQQRAVGQEGDARAEVLAAALRGRSAEQGLDAMHALAVEDALHQDGPVVLGVPLAIVM